MSSAISSPITSSSGLHLLGYSEKTNRRGRNYTSGSAIDKGLRQRIITLMLAQGGDVHTRIFPGTYIAIAEQFSVSTQTVKNIWERFCTTGSCSPKPHAGGRQKKISGADLAYIKDLKEKWPNITYAQIQRLLMLKHLKERKQQSTTTLSSTSSSSDPEILNLSQKANKKCEQHNYSTDTQKNVNLNGTNDLKFNDTNVEAKIFKGQNDGETSLIDLEQLILRCEDVNITNCNIDEQDLLEMMADKISTSTICRAVKGLCLTTMGPTFYHQNTNNFTIKTSSSVTPKSSNESVNSHRNSESDANNMPSPQADTSQSTCSISSDNLPGDTVTLPLNEKITIEPNCKLPHSSDINGLTLEKMQEFMLNAKTLPLTTKIQKVNRTLTSSSIKRKLSPQSDGIIHTSKNISPDNFTQDQMMPDSSMHIEMSKFLGPANKGGRKRRRAESNPNFKTLDTTIHNSNSIKKDENSCRTKLYENSIERAITSTALTKGLNEHSNATVSKNSETIEPTPESYLNAWQTQLLNPYLLKSMQSWYQYQILLQQNYSSFFQKYMQDSTKTQPLAGHYPLIESLLSNNNVSSNQVSNFDSENVAEQTVDNDGRDRENQKNIIASEKDITKSKAENDSARYDWFQNMILNYINTTNTNATEDPNGNDKIPHQNKIDPPKNENVDFSADQSCLTSLLQEPKINQYHVSILPNTIHSKKKNRVSKHIVTDQSNTAKINQGAKSFEFTKEIWRAYMSLNENNPNDNNTHAKNDLFSSNKNVESEYKESDEEPLDFSYKNSGNTNNRMFSLMA